jgi:hypothetical protein
MPRLLDLFCGRWGWSRAFAARGWECYGIDQESPHETPEGCIFIQWDISFLYDVSDYKADFIVASPPCEEFSVFGLKMWHKKPHYPEWGVSLFNRTRKLCYESCVPYIIENVRSAEQFVGPAVSHCGPFYLWGSGVPPLLNQGITKGSMIWSSRYRNMKKSQRKKEVATIPPELANCVADYAERLLEQQAKIVLASAEEKE